MQTPITLSANQAFQCRLATLGTEGSLTEFAWAYVVALSGDAAIDIVDRKTVAGRSETLHLALTVPNMIAAPLRNSEVPEQTELTITAGSTGFKGELHLRMLDI